MLEVSEMRACTHESLTPSDWNQRRQEQGADGFLMSFCFGIFQLRSGKCRTLLSDYRKKRVCNSVLADRTQGETT